MTITKDFGAAVRFARKAAGLSQSDLAGAVGLTRTSICNIEAGIQNVSIRRVASIAGALGLQPADLLPGGDGLSRVMFETALRQNDELRAQLKAVRAVLRDPSGA